MGKTQKFEQVAYLYIKDQILRDNWKTGHHIVEADISDRLSMSRSPIRAALSVLEEEGIVETRPYRGYFVKEAPNNESIIALRGRYALILWFRLLDRMVKNQTDGAVIKEECDQLLRGLKQAFNDHNRENFYNGLLEILRTLTSLGDHDFLEEECVEACRALIAAVNDSMGNEDNDFFSTQIWILMYVENISYLMTHNRFDDTRVIAEMLVRSTLNWLPEDIQDDFESHSIYALR
ncbi:winged helix-turn-helix domain-containing protein [Aerococcus sanguinicola]|uniref:winged helix-turn-helix domain-containing protein n=1 Tax=Aerococcus sanguinicola TaxID=119206 RepID=UPI0018A716C1|nr:winged helix-turn-helix domain-containing protein [Aerococcus sanguinicola]